MYTGNKLKAYYSWKNLKSRARAQMDAEWLKFETYYTEVGDKPSDRHRMHRLDKAKNWGPGNWEWKEDLFERSYKTFDQKAYLKAWREANPGYFRGMRYKRKYGMSLEDYKKKLEEQDGKCAVCDCHETQSQQGTVRQLAIDHDHKTGQVRQLLDNKCNAILGHADDSYQLLAKLIVYLAKHSDKATIGILNEAIEILEEGKRQ